MPGDSLWNLMTDVAENSRAAGDLAAVADASVAAIDLGSNSFHLIVAKLDHGQLSIIDRLRETVRLASGIDAKKCLTREAMDRALECLNRFGQRLRGIAQGNVRAAGTNTLRFARNAAAFVAEAEEALGHPIDVIGGREEARLIYLGVAHGLAAGDERRLVLDIGGGSTELIAGTGFATTHRESLHVGCVTLSNTYFGDGRIKKKKMLAAEIEAELALQPVVARFRNTGWDRAIGCSGTVRAVRGIVQTQGWCKHGVTRSALAKLREAMISAGHVDALAEFGISSDRRPIFPGGVAVLGALFELLDIDRLNVSDQAMREGLLYDLVGRIRHTDVRTQTVQALAKRWTVDSTHAGRVKATALGFLGQLAEPWDLQSEDYADRLDWAAELHEIGLSIAHGQYHKHGAYVVGNADMAGFSRREQAILAALIHGHRRKFPSAEFDALPRRLVESGKRLCVLLRLAALLHRSRSDTAPPEVRLAAEKEVLQIDFPPAWLDSHPLTVADLQLEARYLSAAGIKIGFR